MPTFVHRLRGGKSRLPTSGNPGGEDGGPPVTCPVTAGPASGPDHGHPARC